MKKHRTLLFEEIIVLFNMKQFIQLLLYIYRLIQLRWYNRLSAALNLHIFHQTVFTAFSLKHNKYTDRTFSQQMNETDKLFSYLCWFDSTPGNWKEKHTFGKYWVKREYSPQTGFILSHPLKSVMITWLQSVVCDVLQCPSAAWRSGSSLRFHQAARSVLIPSSSPSVSVCSASIPTVSPG